jgi:phytoene synthase
MKDKWAWHPASATVADYSGSSNLALAFLCLPAEKRADMDVFYTFCRLVDDIADSETLPIADKALQLAAWREALRRPASGVSAASSQPLLVDQLHGLMAKYRVPVEHFEEIVNGVEMDLDGRQYATFEQLREYCYRVASVVGLVSIEIFGYRNEACRRYAVDLGLALQLTNILRDVAVDLDNGGRVYLPLEDLERFGYTLDDLRQRRYDERFLSLMDFEARRAEEYYQSALRSLPPEDRRSMVAAEIMRAVYWRILRKMRRDRFQVFAKRYRLNKAGKLWAMAATVVNNRWGRAV